MSTPCRGTAVAAGGAGPEREPGEGGARTEERAAGGAESPPSAQGQSGEPAQRAGVDTETAQRRRGRGQPLTHQPNALLHVVLKSTEARPSSAFHSNRGMLR